jgi:hypothetical protein
MNIGHLAERIKDARGEVLLVAETHRMPKRIRDELLMADGHLTNAFNMLLEDQPDGEDEGLGE